MVADPLADLVRLRGVSSAVVAARDAVDAVLRDRGMRRVSPEQTAKALLAGARASASLTDDPDRWLPGSVRLGTELVQLSGLIRISPGQALARAHSLLAAGQLPHEMLGRIRSDPGVASRMRGVTSLLTSSTAAPAAVVAAVVHAEIATVAPFGVVDGLVARAVEHMVLVASGVDPHGVIVVSAGHAALRAAYEEALAGYATGGATAVRDWLLHCAAALTQSAELSPVVAPVG
ncbi:MAG TPA: oxidoreductase [Propionibacteriaceae bacterium]